MIDYYPVIKIFLLTALSFVTAIVWTPLLTHILYKYKLGKSIRNEGSTPVYSNLHKHKSGTPTMGGILIWATTLVLTILFQLLSSIDSLPAWIRELNFLTRRETLLPLGALVASALIGLLDDWFNITHQGGGKGGGLTVFHRLIIFTVIAAVGAWWFYVRLEWDVIHIPFFGTHSIGLWYIPFFIFVIVATAFSVNTIDGLDGLAAGVLLSSFGSIGALAFMQGNYNLVAFCGVLVGSLLAFLWFNIAPARFFMGDTGAMALGVTLGILALLTHAEFYLPIIGLLLVVETASVIIQLVSKKFLGRKVFLSAPIHHHFEALGWPETKIVMRFWVISSVCAVLGLILALMDKSL